MDNYNYDSKKTGVNTIAHDMVSTSFDIVGYTTVKNLGVARGIIVRSRSIVGSIGAGLQSILGGDITLFTQLSENRASTLLIYYLSMRPSWGLTPLWGCATTLQS